MTPYPHLLADTVTIIGWRPRRLRGGLAGRASRRSRGAAQKCGHDRMTECPSHRRLGRTRLLRTPSARIDAANNAVACLHGRNAPARFADHARGRCQPSAGTAARWRSTATLIFRAVCPRLCMSIRGSRFTAAARSRACRPPTGGNVIVADRALRQLSAAGGTPSVRLTDEQALAFFACNRADRPTGLHFLDMSGLWCPVALRQGRSGGKAPAITDQLPDDQGAV